MALLLALALPGHLLMPGGTTWPIVPAAGILVVVLAWCLRGLGSGRVHPVVAAYLVLVILFQPILTAHFVLKPEHLVRGDLFRADEIDTSVPRTVPWIYQRQIPDDGRDALDDPDPAALQLTAYTSGHAQPDRFSLSFQMILRDRLPPLEDLILGGEPGPIGAGCTLFVIIGGLFLLYRGLIDWHIPMLAALSAWVAFCILPIPVVITDMGTQWCWLAWRHRYLDWPTGLTLANYELLASPLLFVAFFWPPARKPAP